MSNQTFGESAIPPCSSGYLNCPETTTVGVVDRGSPGCFRSSRPSRRALRTPPSARRGRRSFVCRYGAEQGVVVIEPTQTRPIAAGEGLVDGRYQLERPRSSTLHVRTHIAGDRGRPFHRGCHSEVAGERVSRPLPEPCPGQQMWLTAVLTSEQMGAAVFRVSGRLPCAAPSAPAPAGTS